MRLELGLIGATGIAARAVIAPSGSIPEVAAVAVAASDPDRARTFARRHDLVRVHRDYAALIADPALNAVYVSLHTSAHARWAEAAARAGKHVLVEKPMCLTVAEATALVTAAGTAGVHVSEAVPTAGHPWQDSVRAMIADGRFGPLRVMATTIEFTAPAAGGYRLRPELGGGIFLDAASYWLQAVQATIGLSGARGRGRRIRVAPSGVDIEFAAHLERGGVRAELACRFGQRTVAEHEFRFADARVRVRAFLRPTVGAMPLNIAVRHADGGTAIESFPPIAYYDRQLRRFAELVGDNGPARTAELAATAERIAAMAAIRDDAERHDGARYEAGRHDGVRHDGVRDEAGRVG
ncbi:Gfo/Idh/MocA family oxidoreductase [Micromonospora sp. NBC_01699]|uniref:Gfo/Idh/MocA family protein n=1 Tax=Micromonospora sp. NBC_01699 TaxID=2975984 RepID=UPI002E3251A9|nr:Gfo/Idh/MocA family oxidoreductase [Micromonospora sp. NBC_01699]